MKWAKSNITQRLLGSCSALSLCPANRATPGKTGPALPGWAESRPWPSGSPGVVVPALRPSQTGPLLQAPWLPDLSSHPTAGPALTGSAQQCAHPHSPLATCPPRPAGAGRPSWSQACHGKQTSAGTGSAAPAGAPPAAGDAASHPGDMSPGVTRPPGDLKRAITGHTCHHSGSHPRAPGTLTREMFCTRKTRATKSSSAEPDTNSTSIRPYCCRPGSGQYCRHGWEHVQAVEG